MIPILPLRRTPRAIHLAALASLLALLALALTTLLSACASSTTSNSSYGGPQNHLHDELVLRGSPATLLLATHYGLYRSANAGSHWTLVAGGPGQPMDGLMCYKLAQSPIDLRRIYVLAILRSPTANATPGLYTSADAGQTWKLAAPVSAFPTGALYTIGAGSGGPGQVYALIAALKEHGLYVSDDAGSTWRPAGTAPTTSPSGVTGDPTRPGRLLLWSIATGVYTSDDSGLTWSASTGVRGGVYALALAADTVYASGGVGLFVSHNAGRDFTLTDSADTFSSVVASPVQPQIAYALAGAAVYTSHDGGLTWNRANATNRPGAITADPSDPNTLYIGLSYPLGLIATHDGGHTWRAILP